MVIINLDDQSNKKQIPESNLFSKENASSNFQKYKKDTNILENNAKLKEVASSNKKDTSIKEIVENEILKRFSAFSDKD